MRIQLTLLCLIFSISLRASDESEIKDLFSRYEQVMTAQSEDVTGVFSKSFIDAHGGKDAYLKGIKELKLPKQLKSQVTQDLEIKKSRKPNIFYVKPKVKSELKSNKVSHGGSQFIVIKEDGRFKIEGTLSDDD